MNPKWKIDGVRALVLSDAHQRIDWVKAVLEQERGNFDHIVFLGDWFDSFNEPPIVSGVAETATFVKQMLDGAYGNATLLLGNHDIAYLEAAYHLRRGYSIKKLYNYCSGYTNNKAHKINDVLTIKDWRKMRLFTVVNGWLASHAGFRENNWRPFASVEENYEKLNTESEEALQLVHFGKHPLFAVGFSRGGSVALGGPIWADWNHDFEDNLPVKQIVGHTPKHNTVRSIGGSYCIDGGQSTYAIIQPNGDISFGSIYKFPDVIGDFYVKPVEFIDDNKWVAARKQTLNENLMGRREGYIFE